MKTHLVQFVTVSLLWNTMSNAQWIRTNLPTSATYAYSIAKKDSVMFAGADRVYMTKDNGENWVAVNKGLEKKLPWSLAFQDSSILAGTDSGIYIMKHDSVWSRLDSGRVWGHGEVAALATNGPYIIAGLYGEYPIFGILRSSDFGETWDESDSGLTDPEVRSVLISDSAIYVGCNFGGVYSSSNNGASWARTNLGGYDARSIALNDSFLFVATNSGVFRSSDEGASWIAVDDGLPDTTYYYELAVASVGPNVFVSSEEGHIFLSSNNGTNWTNTNPSSRIYNTRAILISDSNVFVTGSGGVWRRPLSEMISSVHPPSIVRPREFRLEQNYPNPFNPSTRISYSIPKLGHVVLRMSDVLGREMATLVNERKTAGEYTVEWNAASLPSGVYFYRLIAGDFVQTKKMILMR